MTCTLQPYKNSGLLYIAGDSWAVGPATGQPNLGEAFTTQGITNELSGYLGTSTDVLKSLQSYVNGGGTGAPFSAFLVDTGAHDMYDPTPIPSATTTLNLINIASLCGDLGLQCIVIGWPTLATINGSLVITSGMNQSDARYVNAAAQCANINLITVLAVYTMIEHMPGLIVDTQPPMTYVAPNLENQNPLYGGHPNTEGFLYFAQMITTFSKVIP